MLKRIGLSMAVAAGLLAFAAPRQASAETHFGVYIGAAPRVYAPAPVYNYGYDPYADSYYSPAPVYSYPAPVYVSPYSYGYSYRDRGWREREHERHEMMERQRHAEHEWREHNRGWR